jgi:hypothetical protein
MIIYVFGNGNIRFDLFSYPYEYYLRYYLTRKDVHFIVCDFKGVDTLVMELLKTETENVSIYFMGEKPRYLPDRFNTKVTKWKSVGGFSSDDERDNAAIKACTHFLAIDFNTDSKRKSGTQRNIERCLELGKIAIYKD